MKKYDLIVIGLGPAGMAVSIMGSTMGLKVAGIEKNKIGGECLNVGCIPSKALLKAADVRQIAKNMNQYGIRFDGETVIENPLKVVREKIGQISGPKTLKMFDKVDLYLQKGEAEFVDKNKVKIGDEIIEGKKIFIATGTEPFIPPIPGLKETPRLTNMNIFAQESIPKSLTIIGGGAIGVEMAQAFSRLGSKVTIIQMDPYLIPSGDEEAGLLLEQMFQKEGIEVYNSAKIIEVKQLSENEIIVKSDKGEFISEKILVATGRKAVIDSLKLENAGIKYHGKGILVNKYLRTNVKNIYAVGDCNGIALLSHAAMHQGMLALMNALNPIPGFGLKHNKYPVPWSVFTKPEVAFVGLSEKELKKRNIKYMVIKENYEDYGRTIADGHPEGFVKVFASPGGKIYGVSIIGEAASELIQEWTLAIQKKIRLFDIMMTQHSFPTISLMNKRIGEKWMMGKVKASWIQKIIRLLV